LRLFEALYNIDEYLELVNDLKDDRKGNQIAHRDRYSNNQELDLLDSINLISFACSSSF